MKKLFAVMAIVLSITAGSEIHAGNFVTDTEHDPVLISQRNAAAIGKNTDQQMRQTYGISTEQKFNQRINAIGQKLSASSRGNSLSYNLTILDNEIVNAFGAPGGYIYITTGILKRLKNNDEIAGVLGHEIGHVIHQHALKALQRRMIAQFGLQLVAAKLGDNGAIPMTFMLKASEVSGQPAAIEKFSC